MLKKVLIFSTITGVNSGPPAQAICDRRLSTVHLPDVSMAYLDGIYLYPRHPKVNGFLQTSRCGLRSAYWLLQ